MRSRRAQLHGRSRLYQHRGPISHATRAAVAELEKGQRKQSATMRSCVVEKIARNPTMPMLASSRLLAAECRSRLIFCFA
jgi:hypothetical protein